MHKMYKSYEELGIGREPNRDVLDVLEVQNSQHKNQIIKTHKIVCNEIYADWCGPCKQTASTYSIIATNYSKPELCAVVKHNFERMEESEKRNIHGIPVFEFYVDGRKISQIVGADMEQVENKLKSLLSEHGQQYNNMYEEPQKGPVHNRNSIRNNRSQMPQMDFASSAGEPYQSNSNYHQPYMQNNQTPRNPPNNYPAPPQQQYIPQQPYPPKQQNRPQYGQ